MRTLGTAVAAGRVGFGAGLLLAPGPLAAAWVGPAAHDRRTQIALRGFGMRDLALGAGGLAALHGYAPGSPAWWFAAQGAGDAADLAATLAAGSLPTPLRAGIAAFAAGAAGICFAVAASARR